jgi:hypothetical protein
MAKNTQKQKTLKDFIKEKPSYLILLKLKITFPVHIIGTGHILKA